MITINGVKVKSLSCVQLFAIPWTAAYQAPPSLRFSRQNYWSGLLFPSPGDFPDPGLPHCRQMLYPKEMKTYIHTKTFTKKIYFLYLSIGEGHGNPLQYSCLENSMDRGAWWATVHGIAKSWTLLSDITGL